MKSFISYICFIILFILFSDLNAQEKPYQFKRKPDTSLNSLFDNHVQNDSANYLKRGSNGLIIMPESNWTPFDPNISFLDTMFFEPAFLPVIFDGKILPADLSFTSEKLESKKLAPDFHLISPDSTFAFHLERQRQLNELRRDYYESNPELIKYNALLFQKNEIIDPPKIAKKNVFQELITAEGPSSITPPTELEKYVPKIRYWTRTGEHSLQLAQNHISKNWRGGGNSSFFIRNYHKITLNYKKDKITFNNTIEWQLNLQQTPADTVHDVSVNEDMLRIENTLGYKAFDKWSYSAKLETKSTLFNKFPINSRDKTTAFASPLYLNFGIGMNYTLEKTFENKKNKKVKFTQNIAPISVNLIYVGDEDVDETKFGVEKDKTSKFELGSLINADLTFNFNRYMTWTSRFRYYTNYHRSEAEFENKFDMALNRFLSTQMYLYLRFDDTGAKEGNWGYLQRNELISFGLNYKW